MPLLRKQDVDGYGWATQATVRKLNDLVNFIEYLLEYFYVLPSKIENINKKLDRVKGEVHDG